jgi:hypothetical protein
LYGSAAPSPGNVSGTHEYRSVKPQIVTPTHRVTAMQALTTLR